MSQLRKSASFRSRIPVRRARIPNRRCSSPSPSKLSRINAAPNPARETTKTTTVAAVGKTIPRTASTAGSTETTTPAANPFAPSTRSTHSSRHKAIGGCRTDATPRRCYSSSSSFSSSDESYESEAPLQRLVKQLDGAEDAFYTSTDAISLDGLLESVSSGSFSSPPSPVQYQNTKMPQYHSSSYESLDKYNVTLEALKLSENFPHKNIPRSATLERRKERHSASLNNIKLENGQQGGKVISSSIEDNTRVGHRLDLKAICSPSATARCRYEAEKQKNLSDWYYIKSSPGPRPTPNSNQVMEPPSSQRIAPSPLSSAPSSFPFGAMNPKLSRALPPPPPPYPSIRRTGAGSGGDSLYYKNRKRDGNLNFDTRDEFDTEKCVAGRRDSRPSDADPNRGGTQSNLNNFDIKFNLSPNRTVTNDTVPFNQLQPGAAGDDGTSGGGDGKDISNGHPGHWDNIASVGSCAEMGKHVDKHLPITSPCWRQKHIQQDQQQQQQQFQECQALANNNPRRNNHLGRPRIQKRPDETSSSSFEQLNIIGVPINQENRTDPSNLWEWSENAAAEIERKYYEARRRPLPQLPLDAKIFPPKTTTYRSDCELSGSYVSLECPSPPGPPTCLPESRRDPQARLSNYLKTLYTDLALKEPIIPQWAIPVAPGALCPAKLEPELRLHAQSHGFNDCITVDQVLTSIHTKEGTFLEAPRRVLIECPSWASRSNLSLRILHAWAKEPPWPTKGTPVALALFIPLAEIKRSFANYVEKELLPKGPLNPFSSGFGGFTAAWNSLEALGPKLLILLDGYDNQRGSPKRKGKNYPPDVHDLLDGKLFPDARVIITTSTTNNTESLPPIQRHITYEGLTWGRSASLLGGGQWGAPSRLLDTVQECPHLRKAVRTPLGCLAVAAIYEATAGDLPTDELDVIESVLNCVAPETSSNNVAELGRLALFCLKMKRPSITVSEVRMYCSSPESSIMGCLDKGLLLGKTSRKKGELVYNYICPGMGEFLAANYIASLANRPGLLAAEITGLSMGDELDPELLKVITFAMGLLGGRAHVLLSKLTPLWLTPQTIFSLALAGGSSEDNLSALCDMLGISKHPPISPLETKPIWVQIRSVPTELMGWGMALKSPSCTLKNLELIYQLEKHILLDSRNAMEMFLESLASNESVCTLRISSLIETEVKESEINYLANCVSKALLKPRLENFELVLTLLEEDPPILKLQSVVTALCRAIPRQLKLSSVLLDLGLSTSQLVQLCSTLDKCPNITRLSLPHLRCERGAIGALASLLTVRPLSFLALPSCWGARDDPPSSSGVSMGSGSGSSTGTSGIIKQGSLTGVPSPRSYPPGIFSSLPRGVFVPTATMGRSATLPRQPMEPPADKRSSDSVVSKTWYPTPACDGGPHNSGTLHDLLLAAREPYSKLHGMDLSKAQLSLEDSMCLGETVRLSNTLHTLKLEGSSRLSEILPSVLGASESPCLQMLSIGSPRLSLEDSAIAMSARSLTSCSTLRLLSLDGWSFRVENPSTLSIIRAFLSLTSIRELSLANCRLQIGIFRSDTKIINAFESRSVVVLKLSGAQAILGDSVVLRGPQLLPFIGGFPCLRELDLSAPARSGFGSTISSPLILDDKCLINFFQSLHTYFSLLNTLKLCNWVIHFDDPVKTLKGLSKCIRNSPISHLKLDGISVLDRPKKLRIEPSFLHCFISTLPFLRWMGISLAGKKEDQIMAIGNAVLDLRGSEIDIKLSESTIEHAKLMAQAISLDGKFDIKVSTFGTSSGILIHAEKSGTKSLSRKHKD